MKRWPSVILSRLAAEDQHSFVDGPFGSELKTTDYVPSGVPLIRLQNVKPNRFLPKDIRFVSELKARQLARHSYRPGDVVITKLGDPCGIACVVPDSAGCGLIVADVVRFRGNPERIDQRYLAQFINSAHAAGWIRREAKGTTRQRVNLSNFKQLPVPVPPLSEQRRIADILEKADGLRAKRRQALKQVESIAESIFIDMFGDPSSNPRNWPTANIRNLGDIGTGSTPDRADERNFGGDIPWVKTTEVNWTDIVDTEEKLTDRGLSTSRCKVYPRGSVIVALYGQGPTRGRAAILRIDATTNQACGVVQPSSRYEAEFLVQHLRLSYSKLRQLSRGGNQANLNLGLLGGFSVMLPPRSLQVRFVEYVQAITNLTMCQRASLTELDALFASLQHRAFRGEL